MSNIFFIFRKIAIFTGVFIFLLSTPILSVHAQNYVDEGIPEAVKQAREGTLNNEGYVFKQDNLQMVKKIEDMIGAVPGITAVANDPEYNKKLVKKSALYQVNSVITSTFINPPANTYAFLQDFGQSLGFIPKQTYAQSRGAGFSGLAPILPIWKVFRNIAYAIMGLIIMIVGFLIMLRKKIDPKTVVTIQNSIPRIIISLIVITFSYAIVALLIELMYVVMYLLAEIFLSTGLVNNAMDYTTSIPVPVLNEKGMNPGVFAWRVLFGVNVQDGNAAGWMNVGSLAAGGAIGLLLGSVSVPLGFVGLALGAAPMLATFIMAIAMLLLAIRLMFFFLGAYIKLIIGLIFGPIQLIMGAIPGSNATEQWFKGIISNLVVFPIGAAMFMLAQTFLGFSSSETWMWAAPFVGFIDNPISVTSLIALGILFTVPSVANQVQDSFKSKPMVGGGPEAIGGILGQPVTIGWQIGQFIMQRQQMQTLSKAVGKQQGQHTG